MLAAGCSTPLHPRYLPPQGSLYLTFVLVTPCWLRHSEEQYRFVNLCSEQLCFIIFLSNFMSPLFKGIFPLIPSPLFVSCFGATAALQAPFPSLCHPSEPPRIFQTHRAPQRMPVATAIFVFFISALTTLKNPSIAAPLRGISTKVCQNTILSKVLSRCHFFPRSFPWHLSEYLFLDRMLSR